MTLKLGTVPVTAGTDQIQVANNSVIQDLQALTVLMWVMPLAFDNSVNFLQFLWMKGSGATAKQMYIDNNGKINVHLGRATISANAISSRAMVLNEWQFVGFTFDTVNGIQIYLGFERVTPSNPLISRVEVGNPDLLGSGAVSADGVNSMNWGNFPGQNAPFSGLLEMGGIWNRVLTRQQVLEQMQQMQPTQGAVNMYQFGVSGVNYNQKDLTRSNLPGLLTGKLASNSLLISPKAPAALANQRDG